MTAGKPIRKLVAYFDVHYPENINLGPVLKFHNEFNPDVVVWGGDCMDLGYMSHWQELSPRSWENKRLKTDFKEFGKILDLFKVPEVHYITGNHEHWLDQFVDKFPMLEGMFDLESGLELKKRGIRLHKLNDIVKIGKLHFTHGLYTGTHHAQQTVNACQGNVRYGHTHDHQVHSLVTLIDQNPRNAMSCGCLCSKKPGYMKNKPNKWQHGFYVAYILQDGTFTDFFVPIINGKFVFNGKLYD